MIEYVTTEQLFNEDSETGRIMRSLDWSRTHLGPVNAWPQSLRTSVSICLNSAFAILVWWGPELVMLYNDAYIPVIANKHPNAMGCPGKAVFPEIWDTIGPMLESVLQQGKGVRADDLLLFLERNGYPEECYFTFSYSAILDEQGEVAGIFTPALETTERVIGERRLRTLSQLTELGTDQNSDAMQTAVSVMTILDQNPFDLPFAALYLFEDDGSSAKRYASAGGINEQLAPAFVDANAVWPPIADVLSSRAAFRTTFPSSGEMQPLDPWGTLVTDCSIVPSSAAGGTRPRGFMVIGTNPRKRVNSAYQSFLELIVNNIFGLIAKAEAFEMEKRRAEALVEIDRAKTLFFSNVSHEFRTPLTLIMSPLEELLQTDDLADGVRENLELARRNSLRLLKLVNNLLDFAQLEAGRVEAHFEPVDIAQLTKELASGFRSTLERAGLSLSINVAGSMAPVYVDRDMWEKIVLNLLSNAFKFTLQGGIRVEIVEAEGCVQLVVADTGVGIPQSKISLIFDRFQRVGAARGRSFEGSGIGLGLVQELVKLHGGSVSVASEEGVGTRFIVSLPMGMAHLPPGQVVTSFSAHLTSNRIEAFVSEAMRWIPEAYTVSDGLLPLGEEIDAPQGVAETGISARKHVMVADDNPDMLHYIARLLKCKFEVTTVTDGAAALAALHKRRPDLLVSDVMMPEMDGLELLAGIRADATLASLPVILLSARAGEEAHIQGLDSGADDYLVKPFSAKELLAKVSAAIKIAEVRAGAEESMRQSADRLREVLEQTNDAVVTVDANWLISYVNPNAVSLIAKGRDLIGTNLWEEFPDAVDRQFYRQYHLVMDERRTVQFVEHYPGPINRWFDVHAYPAGDGMAVFFRDVTTKRATEAALLQNEKLAAAGRLAASISHEINNPLEAVTNLLYLLQGDADMTPESRSYLASAQEELARVSEITIQTLRFYRQSTNPTLTSLREILDSVLKLYDRRLRDASVNVQRQHRTNRSLMAHSGELRQCFVNFLSNALDAVGQDGEILIRTQDATDWSTGTKGIRVTFADSGSGISKETGARLFEPFFSTKGITGTGLGLWVTKGLIDKHGGKVRVRSRCSFPYRGTSFSIFLPLVVVSASRKASID